MARLKMTAALAAFLVTASLQGCAGPKAEQRPPYMDESADLALSGAEAYSRGDYRMAAWKFNEALRIDRAADDRGAEVRDLINIGRASIALGDYPEARGYLSDAAELAGNIGDERGLAEAYATIAKADYMEGDIDSALKRLEESLAIDGRLGYKSASKLNLKALMYIDAGRLDEAGGLIDGALQLGKDADDVTETANSYRLYGRLNLLQGRLKEALEGFSKAYEMDRVGAVSGRIARDLEGMAEVRLKEGRAPEAAFLLERSYLVNLSAGDMESAIEALDGLIRIYKDAGDLKKAARYSEMREGLLSGNGKPEGKGR